MRSQRDQDLVFTGDAVDWLRGRSRYWQAQPHYTPSDRGTKPCADGRRIGETAGVGLGINGPTSWLRLFPTGALVELYIPLELQMCIQ